MKIDIAIIQLQRHHDILDPFYQEDTRTALLIAIEALKTIQISRLVNPHLYPKLLSLEGKP